MAKQKLEADDELSPEQEAKLLLKANRANIARKAASGKTLRVDELNLLKAQAEGGEDASVWAANKVALAKALGISRPTLDKILKRPGCPGPRANSKWYIAEIRAFYRPDFPTQGDSPLSRREELLCQGIAQKNQERTFDFDVKQGLYILKTVAGESIKECNEKAKGELLRRFLQTAPGEYAEVNHDEAACREINRRHLEEVFAFLNTGDWNEPANDRPIH